MLANSGHLHYVTYVMISSGAGKIKISLAKEVSDYSREFTLQRRKSLRGRVEFMYPGVQQVNHTRSSTDQSINLTCVQRIWSILRKSQACLCIKRHIPLLDPGRSPASTCDKEEDEDVLHWGNSHDGISSMTHCCIWACLRGSIRLQFRHFHIEFRTSFTNNINAMLFWNVNQKTQNFRCVSYCESLTSRQ